MDRKTLQSTVVARLLRESVRGEDGGRYLTHNQLEAWMGAQLAPLDAELAEQLRPLIVDHGAPHSVDAIMTVITGLLVERVKKKSA